jgi:phospholipid-translocating ATPase
MLLMCTWVVVYSFFDSIAFNQEAIVLFSTVGFWTTVTYAIILALGPRFILKFIHEAYFPTDRDIIREAWVVGDLKDRLGIKHRKSSKRATASQMEGASLFRPHMRDLSDQSFDQEIGGYEPAASLHATSFSPAAKPSDNLDLVPPSRRQPTAMSYYSASDIPIAEALIEADHRPNLTLHPSSAHRPPERSGTSPTTSPVRQQSPIRPLASPTRLSPVPAHHGGEFEMSLRPIHSQNTSSYSHTSQASGASFHTASDGGWESQDDDNTTIRRHSNRQSYRQDPHA